MDEGDRAPGDDAADGAERALSAIAEAALGCASVAREPADPGPHAVRIADRLLRDEVRGLELPVRIYYPAADLPERLPAIVFSHGLGGTRHGYAWLGRSWASHGIVSLHPTHGGSGAGLLRRGRVEALRAMKAAIEDPRNWEERTADVSFLLQAAPLLGAAVPALEARIDPARLAVGGHSFGAFTALLVAGARVTVRGAARDFGDRRCRAALALSPPGAGERGLESGSFAAIDRPFLSMTGSEDVGLRGQPASWREEPFRAMPAGGKWLVVLEGAEHFTFSGGRPRRPAPVAQRALIERATRAFLRCSLAGDAAAGRELGALATQWVRIEAK
ncbi:MAG: hypothetical protein NVSMB23_09110 [Myxococcales bacterium]